MYGKIKNHGKKVSIAVIIVMLVTAVPVAYITQPAPETVSEHSGEVEAVSSDTLEPEHNGQAEAVAPAVFAGGVLLGTAIGAGIQRGLDSQPESYLDDANETVQEDINDTIENTADDTLRQAVHSNAIVSEGSNVAFLDNVDNDQTTIEGQVEQRASQRMLRVGDNVTSETELINEAEDEASDYLQIRQSNFLEGHNFQALSVKQYNSQLHTANYSGDITTISDSQYKQFDSDIVINDDDVDSNGVVTINGFDNIGDPTIIDLNGNEIREGDNFSGANVLFSAGNAGKVVVKDGSINTPNITKGYRSLSQNSVNLDLVNLDFNVGNYEVYADTFYDGVVSVYNGSSNINVGGGNVNVGRTNQVDKVFSSSAVTFNATEIANANSNIASASDVPVAEFENNNETVTLPAVNVSLDSSYMGQNNTVKFATPYRASDGKPLVGSDGTGESLIIQTPTSGVSYVAEPVDFTRAYDILTTTDSLASQTYSSVSSYASQQWTKYIQEISSTNKTISDNENLTKDLGQLTTPAPTSPDEATIQYTGIYEGTTLPSSDVIHVRESDGDEYAGALFSTDMSALMSQTNNTDKVEEGDTFDASVTNRTFIVSDTDGSSNDLEGTVEVTLIEGKSSAEVREYGLERTDLGGQAERLADQAEVTRNTVDDPGIYVPPGDGGNGLPFSPTILLGVFVGAVVLVILND